MPKKELSSAILSQITLICRALDDKKAEHIQVLDVRKVSTITDFIIMASGNSEPQLRALRVAVEKAVDEAGIPVLGIETSSESGWVVVDCFNIMIHIFRPEIREQFRLDKLWKDGTELPLERFLESETSASKK